MSTQRIPSSVAQGKRPPFPKGVFIGTIEAAKTDWSQDQTKMVVLVTLTNNSPADSESPQVGARKKMQRIQIIDRLKDAKESVALVDVTDFNDISVPISIQRSATLVTQLALALGAAKAVEGGDVDLDTEQFLEALTSGAFNGREVVFEVNHREWKSKTTGSSGVSDDIVHFASADAVQVPVDAEESPAPAEAPKPALSGMRTR